MEDKEILIKLKSDDSRHHAFNILDRKCQTKVYGLARKMGINHEDAVNFSQDVFLNPQRGMKGNKRK